VTVERSDEARENTLETADAATEGDSSPAVVSFAMVGELRKILTDRRIELSQTLLNTDGAAESISVLADELNRDYRTVHGDVSLLADYGLLFVFDEGQSKTSYCPASGFIPMSTSLVVSQAKSQRLRENLFCYLQPINHLSYKLLLVISLEEFIPDESAGEVCWVNPSGLPRLGT
jgi:Predicted transcriptional regulator